MKRTRNEEKMSNEDAGEYGRTCEKQRRREMGKRSMETSNENAGE